MKVVQRNVQKAVVNHQGWKKHRYLKSIDSWKGLILEKNLYLKTIEKGKVVILLILEKYRYC